MCRISRTHGFWCALVLVEVIALGLSFASSAWLVKESVVLPVEYGGDGNITASFSCGPFSYCLTNIQGGNSRTALNAKAPDVLLTVGAAEFCITGYGARLSDLPFSSWIHSVFFVVVSALLWLATLTAAMASLCRRSAVDSIRAAAPFASLLLVIGLALTLDGVKESKPDSKEPALNQKLCRMCSGAGSFQLGDCAAGWGLLAASGTAIAGIFVVALGFAVPHTYSPSRKIHPEGSAA